MTNMIDPFAQTYHFFIIGTHCTTCCFNLHWLWSDISTFSFAEVQR